MKIAKQVIGYYVKVTGNPWSSFFEYLEEAMSKPLAELTGELWLIHALMDTIIKYGMSVAELRANKDAIKASFDEEGRKAAGEFFTPIIWAEEAHRYLDKYVPNWRTSFKVWECSAGTGNLVKTAGVVPSNLFLSTLQQDDVDMLKTMPEFQGAHIFQCDFLSEIDLDKNNTNFLDKLDPELKQAILNDEPLLIFANPPYKSGSAKATDVGNYMSACSTPEVNLAKPAYDIFYQFCWRIMHFVEMFDLHNCYYGFFGPLTFFAGASANILLKEFEHCFEFLDGMCISAQEFSDTSESITWGIGFSVWKSRGGYIGEQGESQHKDIVLDKKIIKPDGSIGFEGKMLYEPPREPLSVWIKPKDVCFYEDKPVMTSHLTFKGSEVFEKVAPRTGKMAENALGTLMNYNTLARSADKSAILSMPTTMQFVDITEENFWRCVASFAFRGTIDTDWALAKKNISAPNVNTEGYDIWIRNALVSFLFEYKSMASSLRNVEWNGEKINIRNKLFPFSAEEIKAHCTDPVILKDIEDNPPENKFMLRMIEESMPYWVPETRQVYDWVKSYLLATLDVRKQFNYHGSLECWDAGFQQLRSSNMWIKGELDDQLTKVLSIMRDYLRKDLFKFGFVSDVDTAEDY